MQLRITRLCLDCEELHTEDRCPACTSEAFSFLTRWVPATELRSPRRPPAQPVQPKSRMAQVVKGGVLGVVLLTVGRLLWRATDPATAVGDSTRKDSQS